MLSFTDLIDNGKITGLRVFIRSDLNVPRNGNGEIIDDTRIRYSVPSIRAAMNAGASVMVASHLGRPIEGIFDERYSLAPVAKRLGNLLGKHIPLIKNWIEDKINISPGQVVLLENCRMNKGEKENSETLSKYIAGILDIYVNDAFGVAHRAEVTTHGVARFAPISCAGPLLLREIKVLENSLRTPRRPLIAVIGGSKISTKLNCLKFLASQVDQLIVGGGIANMFMLANGLEIGRSLAECKLVDETKKIIKLMKNRGALISSLNDVVVGKSLLPNTRATVKSVNEISTDDIILDIGPSTANVFAKQLQVNGTIIWNGPVGAFEFPAFENGTRTLSRAIAISNAFSIAGGGETLAAIAKYGISQKIDCISTGGGAFLAFLEGKTLPALQVLESRYEERFQFKK